MIHLIRKANSMKFSTLSLILTFSSKRQRKELFMTFQRKTNKEDKSLLMMKILKVETMIVQEHLQLPTKLDKERKISKGFIFSLLSLRLHI